MIINKTNFKKMFRLDLITRKRKMKFLSSQIYVEIKFKEQKNH